MDIRILEKQKQHEIYDSAYRLLAEADNEFVPPLSSRSSSTQQNFSNTLQSDNITTYFEQLKNQRFAVVFEEGELISFVSFKENYTCSEISENELPNIYLSTLVVSPKARGKGVTTALYQKLFTEYEKVNIFTRTWSTNFAHIKILGKYGFEVIKVLKDDRGIGIDTVYFKKAKKI
ncbi:MAG: GNAT family N-acetyltransferase [Clostridia bacterium]|nr:GNAT family N-acetyltransferase [Clostridia bacterium]